MGVPWDFLAGAAVIAMPQYQIPLLVGSASVKGVLAVRDSRRRHADSNDNGASANGTAAEGADGQPGQVTLRWRQLAATLTDKRGNTKELLSLSGSVARPGRWDSS